MTQSVEMATPTVFVSMSSCGSWHFDATNPHFHKSGSSIIRPYTTSETFRQPSLKQQIQMNHQRLERASSSSSTSEPTSRSSVALAQRLRRTKRRLLLSAVGQDIYGATCPVSAKNHIDQKPSFDSFASDDSTASSPPDGWSVKRGRNKESSP